MIKSDIQPQKIKVGDTVRIAPRGDIWRQGTGVVTRFGKSIPGLSQKYDAYIQTESAGEIGYQFNELEVIRNDEQ